LENEYLIDQPTNLFPQIFEAFNSTKTKTNLHFPGGDNIVQIVMRFDMLFAIWPRLVDRPSVRVAQTQLFSQFHHSVAGRVGRVDVNGFGATVQEEEPADDGAEASHGLKRTEIRQFLTFLKGFL
jgi:hypothetical protein